MKQCEFCGASLPDYASFCGKCGRSPFSSSQGATYLNHAPDNGQEDILTLTEDISLSLTVPLRQTSSPSVNRVPHPVTLIPLHDENIDEDEEKRRRVALLGMGLLLPEQLANLPMSGPPPVIAGTPQMAQVPVIPNTLPTSFPPGTPSLQGAAPGSPHLPDSGLPLQQAQAPQPLSAAPPAQTGKPPSVPAHHSGSFGHHQANPAHSHFPKPGRRPHPQHFPGCLTMLAIFLGALIAIISTSLALATTVFGPGLSISGNANVAPGGVLILHGHNFLSNSNVTLTFDNNIPVLLLSKTSIQPSRNTSQGLDSAALVLSSFQVYTAYNMLSTHSDGTFNATIQVEQTWTPGHHTIHATEVTSHRSASLSFVIMQVIATATPTPSPIVTATATPTPSPTATTTATPTPSPTATAIPTSAPTPRPTPTTAPKQPPTLSCATPGNLSLGPINASSSQPASANVTLCSSGSGTLTWKASWNQDTANWLQISQSSGSIQAPHSAKITVSASAAHLEAGTYTTTITFTDEENNSTQKVTISFTVKSPPPPPPTISVSPTSVDANSAPCNNSSGGDSGGGDSICTITLTNNSGTNALDWSWSAKGNGSVQANSTTIAAGGTETVEIDIPSVDCGTPITVAFYAPGNTVDVTWNCTPSAPRPTVTVTVQPPR